MRLKVAATAAIAAVTTVLVSVQTPAHAGGCVAGLCGNIKHYTPDGG